jgi:F-type H+-transporting ATPase subunit epsilon
MNTEAGIKTIRCDIVSAHRGIFSGEVRMIVASGISGELGIYPRHTPMITQLKPGPVRIQDASGEDQFYFVSGGIMEVQPHLVTVVADTVLRSEELDQSAAEAARAEAERELKVGSDNIEIDKAHAKLLKAVAELQTLDRIRKMGKR